MKKLIAGLCVLISLTASAQWDTLHTGTKARLKGLSFLNTNVGLTCGYDTASSKGIILYTADAGTSWNIAATTDSVKYKLHSVSYVNANVAIAVGDSGRIMRSVSSGLSWSALPVFTDKHLYALQFLNDTLGFIAGEDGVLFRTGDAGATWDTIVSGTAIDLYAVKFTDLTTGWIAGDGGYIAKTTDGGLTWTMQLNPFFGFLNVRGMDFVDASRGYCVGLFGYAIQTTDGGLNWTAIPGVVTTNSLYAVKFVNGLGGVIAGFAGTIFRTEDGGASWNEETMTTITRALYAVDFSNDTTAYICGTTGTMLHSASDISSVFTQSVRPIGINVFPNPVTDGNVHIRLGEAINGACMLQLFDLQGRVVLEKNYETYGPLTDLLLASGELPAETGTYIIRISYQDRQAVGRITRQ